MPAHMAYEINGHAPGPLIVEIAIEAQGAEMPTEFAQKEGRRLAATGVTGALAAEEDEGAVGTGAGWEWGGWGEG